MHTSNPPRVHLHWIPQHEASTARWVVWSAGFRILGTPGSPCGALDARPGEVRVATPQAWRLSNSTTSSWYRDSAHRDQVLLISVEPLPDYVRRWEVEAPALYGAPGRCRGPSCHACAWLAGITLRPEQSRRAASSRRTAARSA
jgi:hypothetical protein